MSNIEKGFIPLRIVEEQQPLETVVFSLGLPEFVDKDRIGVNLGRIDRLQRIAGIKQITVTGRTFDETSGVDIQIVGMNPDGSAMAGKGGSKTAIPAYESHPLVANDRVPMSQRQINLNISANLDEIASRLTDSKDGVRSPKRWAKELDKGVRDSINKAGTDNLIRNIDNSTKFNLGFGLGSYALIALFFDQLLNGSFSNFPKLYEGALIGGYIGTRIASLAYSRKLQGHRFSFSIGPQFDRAVVLRTLTSTQKLVKDLHPDKK